MVASQMVDVESAEPGTRRVCGAWPRCRSPSDANDPRQERDGLGPSPRAATRSGYERSPRARRSVNEGVSYPGLSVYLFQIVIEPHQHLQQRCGPHESVGCARSGMARMSAFRFHCPSERRPLACVRTIGRYPRCLAIELPGAHLGPPRFGWAPAAAVLHHRHRIGDNISAVAAGGQAPKIE